jgi:curved DNA-binding protein CbpA
MTTDHYETLGVAKDAEPGDIKRAYRHKASEAHPDRHGGDDAKMAEVNRAYAVLADPDRRERYDACGEDQPVKSMDDRARDYLLAVLQKMLAQDVNPIADSRRAIQQELHELDGADRIVKERIAKLERRRGRVRRKGEGVNLVHQLIDQALAELTRKIPEIADARMLGNMALGLLDAYEEDSEAAHFPGIHIRSTGTSYNPFR